MISFKVDRSTRQAIREVLDRAMQLGVVNGSQSLDIGMSLCACIAQGTKINLARLKEFDAFNLSHDLWGIHRWLDKDDNSPTAGKLLGHFRPRCGILEDAAEQATRSMLP